MALEPYIVLGGHVSRCQGLKFLLSLKFSSLKPTSIIPLYHHAQTGLLWQTGSEGLRQADAGLAQHLSAEQALSIIISVFLW